MEAPPSSPGLSTRETSPIDAGDSDGGGDSEDDTTIAVEEEIGRKVQLVQFSPSDQSIHT